MIKENVRNKNGNLRRKNRQKFRAMQAPCGICNGLYGPIHYNEPSDSKHPLSFVIDEVIPVSKWKEFGYESARAVAEDWNNLQAAHYYCNALKSDKLNFSLKEINQRKIRTNVLDGQW